jgi:type IX secretion system PorP/SprF family membrane protein
MRRAITALCLLWLPFCSQAQFFQFSQRSFTPQRVNPALVGSRDYLHVMMNFRNQSTAGDFSLLSTALDLAYPVSWGGQRKGGVGLFLMDDRSGSGGVYSIQEAEVSTGISVSTSATSSFNLGIGMGYQRKAFDFNGLSTGSQFVEDRGFDLSLGSGEDFSDLGSTFYRWNVGLYWQSDLENGMRKSYIGVAAYDVNRADESTFDREARLPVSFVADAGTMINRTLRTIMWAEGFVYGSGNNLALQAGVTLDREIGGGQHLKMTGRYSTESFVIVGATIEMGEFAVGATYDIGVGQSSVANQSAFEVGLQWKLYKAPKGRKKRKGGQSTGRTRPPRQQPTDSLTVQPEPELTVEQEEKSEPDSTRAGTQPDETGFTIGQPRSTSRIVEEYEVRLPFRFNSFELSEEFTAFLDDVVDRLRDNPGYSVEVTGHTDSVGSDDVNERISLARAQAAADYLMSKGIAASRIKVEGKGETLPISSNDTAAGRALNRRVEITILR